MSQHKTDKKTGEKVKQIEKNKHRNKNKWELIRFC